MKMENTATNAVTSQSLKIVLEKMCHDNSNRKRKNAETNDFSPREKSFEKQEETEVIFDLKLFSNQQKKKIENFKNGGKFDSGPNYYRIPTTQIQLPLADSEITVFSYL